MTTDYAQLNELAAGEIDELKAEGFDLTPADIVELNALGWAVQTPQTRMELSRGTPVQAGNVTLWPITLHGTDWYRRTGCKVGLDNYALAYAMAHSQTDPDNLDCHNRVACWARVVAWAATLRCTWSQLQEAMSQIIAQSESPDMPPDPVVSKISIGEISARLAINTGESVEFWERRCSRAYAVGVLIAAMSQANESGKPLPTDPVIMATRALGWAAEKIRRRHKEQQCQNVE